MDILNGWWYVLSLTDGTTIEGENLGMDNDAIVIRVVPSEIDLRVEWSFVQAFDAYENKPELL